MNKQSKILACVLTVLLGLTVVLSGCATSAPAESHPIAAHAAEPIPSATDDIIDASAVVCYNVSIDVNPSISITIENDVVVDVSAYNDDGKRLTLGVDVIGTEKQQVLSAIIAALVADGYIQSEEEAYFIVTVTGDEEWNDEIAKQFKHYAEEALEEHDVEWKVKSTRVTSDISEKANEYGLSAGRYLLLEYVSQIEGITMEEAITLYGDMKIRDLMDTYEDAEDLFDEDNELDEVELPSLTEEQRAIIKPALAAFEKQIKEAEDAFNNEFESIEDSYVETIRLVNNTKVRMSRDRQEVLNQLRSDMIQERKAALNDMFDMINMAKSEFLSAVADTGIPQDVLVAYLNAITREVDTMQDEYNDLLSEFRVDDDDDDDDDEDEDEDDDDDDDDDDEDDDDDDDDEDDDEDDDDEE